MPIVTRTIMAHAILALALSASESVPFAGGYLASGPATTATGSDCGVIAYHPDGSINTTLDADGRLRTDIASGLGAAQLYVNGGLIYACGYSQTSGGTAWVIKRYTAAMVPDSAWGGTGSVTITIDAMKSHRGIGLAFTSDDKVVVSGAIMESTFLPKTLALVRLHGNGSLDPTFGTGGKFTFTPSAPSFENTDAGPISILPNGKILVAASSSLEGHVLRVTSAGTLDATYGVNGKAKLNQTVKAVLVQSDGGCIVAGWDGVSAVVTRLLPTGSVDGTFGTGGRITLATIGAGTLDYTAYYPYDLADIGGALYASGHRMTYVNGMPTEGRAFIWKMTASGTVSGYGIAGSLKSIPVLPAAEYMNW